MTSPYQTLDRAELRAALDASLFARRDEGYGLGVDAIALISHDGVVEHAWGDDEGQLAEVRRALEGFAVRVSLRGRVFFRSSRHPTPLGAYSETVAELDALRLRLAEWGMELVTCGVNPWAADGDAFATPVFAPFGSPASTPLRWRAAHNLVPLAEAVFAFSPIRGEACEGWHSFGAARRQLERSSAPAAPAVEGRPLDDFLDWALDAPCDAAPRRLSFRVWARHGVGGVFPDLGDFREHLTSLRAPVLPERGLALRAQDSQARAFWSTPLLWWSVLLEDPAIAREIASWDSPSRARMDAAAQSGLRDSWFAERARRTFALAAESLLQQPPGFASPEMLAAFLAFGERFALRGRTPADECLARFARRGRFDLGEYRSLDADWLRAAGVTLASRPAA